VDEQRSGDATWQVADTVRETEETHMTDDLFGKTCALCRHWQPTTAYITSGRTCHNPESVAYGLRRQYGDNCDRWEEKDHD